MRPEKLVRVVGALVDPVPAEAMQPANNTRTFTISTRAVDREGDIMEPTGCVATDYMRNPVVLWAHDYLGGGNHVNIVGRTMQLSIRPDDIVADVEYAPTAFAQEVKALVDAGFIKGASIGFMPADGGAEPIVDRDGKQTGVRYTKWHLLEWSHVPVPSNQDALVHMLAEARTKGLQVGAIELAMKPLVTKPGLDETDDSFRYRLRDPGQFEEGTFRTITLQEKKPKIKAVAGKLKGGDGTMKLQTLIFPKSEGWERTAVRDWLGAHPDIGKSADGEVVTPKAADSWKVGGVRGLPLNEDRSWDASAAVGRVRSWAGGDDKDKIDWGKYRKAFIVNNGQEDFGGVKLPFADVIDGRLVAIKRGLVAARAAVHGARGGAEIGGAKDVAEAFIDSYLGKQDEGGKDLLGELESAWDETDTYRKALLDIALGEPGVLEKIGAVLSRVNRDRIAAAHKHLGDAAVAQTEDGKNLDHVLDHHDAADELHQKILDRFTDADQMVRSLIGIRAAGGDMTSEVGIQAMKDAEARILKDALGGGYEVEPAPPLGSSTGRDEYAGGGSDPEDLRQAHRLIRSLGRMVKGLADPLGKAARSREKAARAHQKGMAACDQASRQMKDVLDSAGGNWQPTDAGPEDDDTAETGNTGKGIMIIKEESKKTAPVQKSPEPVIELDVDPSTLRQMLRETMRDELNSVLGKIT